jgi:hypothetical protein
MDLMYADRLSWGAVYQIEFGSSGYWELGPLRVWARRDTREWSVSFAHGHDPLSDVAAVQIPSRSEPEGDITSRRFGFRVPPAEIRLTPALAKRPIVVTPEEPFLLPPNEETTLYVSTSVWVRVEVGEPPVQLLEEASHRPSDTWFGESTREGELCYATRTRATLDRAELPICAHRALSVVHIRNRAASVLEIEKVKLPAPNMSLFLASDGHLWTEEVSFNREQEGQVASVLLAAGPPAAATAAERLVGPRKKVDKGFMDRTFGGFIRELRG